MNNLSYETSKSYQKNNAYFGYTLLEMVIVLAIIALLLGVAFFNLRGVGSLEAERQLVQMEQELRSLRSKAIRNRVKTEFVIRGEEYILYVDEKEVGREELVKGLTYIRSDLGRGESARKISLAFSTSGRPARAGSIYFKAGRREKRLVVAPVTGKISIEVENEKE